MAKAKRRLALLMEVRRLGYPDGNAEPRYDVSSIAEDLGRQLDQALKDRPASGTGLGRGRPADLKPS